MTIQFVPASGMGVMPCVWSYDTLDIGQKSVGNSDVFGRQRLPGEPLGNTVLTFEGVNAGSEIRMYLPSGAEAAGVESCSADHQLNCDFYGAGDPNNTLIIRIVHTAYKIKEFTFTVQPISAQSMPIQQEPDKWFSNP